MDFDFRHDNALLMVHAHAHHPEIATASALTECLLAVLSSFPADQHGSEIYIATVKAFDAAIRLRAGLVNAHYFPETGPASPCVFTRHRAPTSYQEPQT